MAEDLEATEQKRRRVIWLQWVFAALGIFLLVRLAWWQLSPHPELISLAMGGIQKPSVIPAVRGSILDATGHYLAVTTVRYTVGVSPRLLTEAQKRELAPKLAQILGEPEERIRQLLALDDREYVLLKREAPASARAEIEALGPAAVAFNVEPKFRRLYPNGELAAHVLGFVGHEGRGEYGVEQYYEQELRGSDGQWGGIQGPWGEQILALPGKYKPVRDGANLILTLDRNIQYVAESILRQGIKQNKASAGTIVVLDPRTGAILAMANYPAYNPQFYWRVEKPERYINTAVSALYEPGSVFKPLTLAAALEARVIRPDDTYDDRGEIIVGGQRIKNSDRRAHGRTTMTGILAHSLNVGAAYVATLLGPTRFYEMMRRFGFGEITGVDLALESGGLMRVPGDSLWHISDLGTNSFGQGIAVTPLQVVAAYAAIANDGVLMRPYIVSEICYGDHTERKQPFRVRRVISEQVAQEITQMMVDAVEIGMRKAVLPGYKFAGKSGTA
ncbi:MAG: penicillin-binding protein 2, partial [Anaerolineae bacterium]|nr:penicillin-binding protein 2 [Anaerolineae bacterium]